MVVQLQAALLLLSFVGSEADLYLDGAGAQVQGGGSVQQVYKDERGKQQEAMGIVEPWRQ